MPKTITFVRHGQSLANAGGVTMAHDAIPLTDFGHRQAAVLAETLELRPARIWVSAYDRAGATAAPFCARVGMRAEVHPALHEFSAIDPALLEGMTGTERRPIADAYWQAGDPARRMGPQAETFAEFDARVGAFIERLDEHADGTLLFGHGQWFGLVVWKLLGFGAAGPAGTRAFRRFQLGLPMPNCATYLLLQDAGGNWRVRADERVMRRMAAVGAV